MRTFTVSCLTAACLASAALAAPPPVGVPDAPAADVCESEANNTFATRDVLPASDACRWRADFCGRLGARDTGHPDTVLGFYDILGRPVGEPADAREPTTLELAPVDASPDAAAQALAARLGATSAGERGVGLVNDDGGPYRRWGGSALFFLQEGPFGSRIRITGKGCDPLDFGGPACDHDQSGDYEVIINWFAAGNNFIGRTVIRAALDFDTDLDEFNLNPPAGTFDFDVIVKTISEYTGDVDFFEFTGLRPNEEYIVQTQGLHARHDRTLDTILGRFNAAGALQATNDDIGLVGAIPFVWWNRNSRFSVTANAAGRIFVAVTGYNDFDFDGREDPDDDLRHDEQGSYVLTLVHRCDIGCADANGDCEVNFADITHVLTFWGFHCQ